MFLHLATLSLLPLLRDLAIMTLRMSITPAVLLAHPPALVMPTTLGKPLPLVPPNNMVLQIMTFALKAGASPMQPSLEP